MGGQTDFTTTAGIGICCGSRRSAVEMLPATADATSMDGWIDAGGII